MNLPNKLSLTRMIIVPIMMFFYLADFVPYGKFIATGLFIIGAITDFLDGKIARKYNLVTDLGKFLDPIADKMLVTCALILICCDGTVPAPFGAISLAIIIGRDLAINMLRQVASTKGVVIAADKIGKYKTFAQDVALPVLMCFAGFKMLASVNGVFEATSTFMTIFAWVGYALLILCVLLTIISLIAYMIKNKAIFAQNK
ncbi:MAG: CDP-diacylglycerol--glycerol-3-phosphate 3-phosphatidyltransferase [Christensenellales bacterium]